MQALQCKLHIAVVQLSSAGSSVRVPQHFVVKLHSGGVGKGLGQAEAVDSSVQIDCWPPGWEGGGAELDRAAVQTAPGPGPRVDGEPQRGREIWQCERCVDREQWVWPVAAAAGGIRAPAAAVVV